MHPGFEHIRVSHPLDGERVEGGSNASGTSG